MNAGAISIIEDILRSQSPVIGYTLDFLIAQIKKLKLKYSGTCKDLTQVIYDGDLSLAKDLLAQPLVQEQLFEQGHHVLLAATSQYLNAPQPSNKKLLQTLLNTPGIIHSASAGLMLPLEGVIRHKKDEDWLFEALMKMPGVQEKLSLNHNRLLVLAASKGKLNYVNRFLEDWQVRHHLEQQSCMLVLSRAAQSGRVDVMQRLLEFPFMTDRVHQSFGRWGSPIEIAIRFGHLDMIQLLMLYTNVKQSVYNHSGPILNLISGTNYVEVMKYFLSLPGFANCLTPQMSAKHPLAIAIKSKQKAMVDFLLENDAIAKQIQANAFVFELAYRYMGTNTPGLLNKLYKIGASLNGIKTFWQPPHLYFANASVDEYLNIKHKIFKDRLRGYYIMQHRARAAHLSDNLLVNSTRVEAQENPTQYALGIISHSAMPRDLACKIVGFLPFMNQSDALKYHDIARQSVQKVKLNKS